MSRMFMPGASRRPATGGVTVTLVEPDTMGAVRGVAEAIQANGQQIARRSPVEP